MGTIGIDSYGNTIDDYFTTNTDRSAPAVAISTGDNQTAGVNTEKKSSRPSDPQQRSEDPNEDEGIRAPSDERSVLVDRSNGNVDDEGLGWNWTSSAACIEADTGGNEDIDVVGGGGESGRSGEEAAGGGMGRGNGETGRYHSPTNNSFPSSLLAISPGTSDPRKAAASGGATRKARTGGCGGCQSVSNDSGELPTGRKRQQQQKQRRREVENKTRGIVVAGDAKTALLTHRMGVCAPASASGEPLNAAAGVQKRKDSDRRRQLGTQRKEDGDFDDENVNRNCVRTSRMAVTFHQRPGSMLTRTKKTSNTSSLVLAQEPSSTEGVPSPKFAAFAPPLARVPPLWSLRVPPSSWAECTPPSVATLPPSEMVVPPVPVRAPRQSVADGPRGNPISKTPTAVAIAVTTTSIKL